MGRRSGMSPEFSEQAKRSARRTASCKYRRRWCLYGLAERATMPGEPIDAEARTQGGEAREAVGLILRRDRRDNPFVRSLVAIGLALLSVGPTQFEPDRRLAPDPIAPHSAPQIGSLRVCAYEAFSLRLSRCVRDQRKTALTSSRFVCSAAVTAPRPTTLRLQWTYEGVKLPRSTTS